MEPQIEEIIHFQVIQELKLACFPIPTHSVRTYPDGSLWMDNYAFRDNASDFLRSRTRRQAVATMRFRPLGPFGESLITLTYPGSYAVYLSRFEECPLVISPAYVVKVLPQETELSQLNVRIQFHRQCSDDTARSLASSLLHWFDRIGRVGVFEEEGICSISQVLRILDQDVAFTLDASRSGQHTLNSLVLAILTWGISSKKPLYLIDLVCQPYEPVLSSTNAVALTG
jgi:hypothetical protein